MYIVVVAVLLSWVYLLLVQLGENMNPHSNAWGLIMIFWWGSHCRHWSYTPIHCEFGAIWADGGVNFESNHAHFAVIRHSWIEFTICGCLSYWLRMTCSQLCQISREYPWYFLKSQTLKHLDEALHRLPITAVNIWNMFVTNCLRPWETCTSWSTRLPEKKCVLCVYVSEHLFLNLFRQGNDNVQFSCHCGVLPACNSLRRRIADILIKKCLYLHTCLKLFLDSWNMFLSGSQTSAVRRHFLTCRSELLNVVSVLGQVTVLLSSTGVFRQHVALWFMCLLHPAGQHVKVLLKHPWNMKRPALRKGILNHFDKLVHEISLLNCISR